MEKNLMEKFKGEIRSTVVFHSGTLEELENENKKFFTMIDSSIQKMKNSGLFSKKEMEELNYFSSEYLTLAYTQAKTKIITNLRNNWKFFK